MVALSATFAAGNGVFARLVIDAGVAPADLAATRIYGAAPILILAFLPHARKLRRADLIPIALFGAFGLVLGPGTHFQAIAQLNIALVLVIIFTAPLVVAAYQRIRHGETLPRYAYAAMGVAVLGVAFAILGSGDGIGVLSLGGLAFALLAMISYAVSVILAVRLPTALPPLARTGACMTVAALIWFVFVPPWTLPFELLGDTTKFDGHFGFSVPVWSAVLFVVLIGSVGVYVCWVGGTSRIGAGASSVVGMTEPVLGGLIAWALLGQTLAPMQSLGIAITVAGIVVVEHARIRSADHGIRDVPVDL